MINLDAARAARREAKGKGPVVRSGGKEYELAPEIAFSVIEGLAKMEDGDASRGLVGVAHGLFGEHYDAIVTDLAVDDFNDLLAQVLEEYGVSAPLPSNGSSPSTTQP
jgi:hypothetical protein